MGRVEVLHPHNLLKARFNRQTPRRFQKEPNAPNPKPNPNSYPTKPDRRRRVPHNTSSNRNTRTNPSYKDPNHELIPGQIKILKRGEVLTDVTTTVDKDLEVGSNRVAAVDDLLVLSSTDRLGPEPDMIPKQIGVLSFSAGSALIPSPPPSSLPQPVFFKKKNRVGNNDDATSDLRRLLKLDLD